MANVFVLLRDEKKSPEVNKRRQIPLISSLNDIKSSGSSCEKSLTVSIFALFSQQNVVYRLSCADLTIGQKSYYFLKHQNLIKMAKSLQRFHHIMGYNLVIIHVQLSFACCSQHK